MNWRWHICVTDLLGNEDMPFEQRRDGIVARFRASEVYAVFPNGTLASTLDDLAATADPDEFDDVWDEVYDWADDHALWIEGIRSC
jgi:hypothetical protein